LKLFEKENVTKDHPKFISRKKKKTICKRKKNLSDEGAIVLFEGYNLLDDGSFSFLFFFKKNV
jgi:hypothetical protein